MKIAVLDDYQNVVIGLNAFQYLQEHDVKVFNDSVSDEAVLIERLKPFEALVLIRERTQITENLLANLPNLKLISQTGKVSNHIDVALCERYGVTVLEGIGSPVAPAELCWGLILAASRHLPSYVQKLQVGEWQQNGGLGLGRTLSGRTLGIWGLGKIGQRIAQFGQVFGMQILVWGSEASRQKALELGYQPAADKAEFFAKADVLSLHLRLNDATRGIVTKQDLLSMKTDSLFVNTSRAELVESGALYQVMHANPTRQAAVDVYENEPALPSNEPLLSLPNVLCAPHLGYVEKNSYEIYFQAAFENVIGYAQQIELLK
ncbi:D-2-hydroxyacid dehydrogenase family protein [Vibrio mimicus]|uniref:3-phosphoglycerate dehydrogenase n=1 Tax=Vibrio mimicus TaxID=674 RepID=A0A2J9VK20_VIBMI|nr:D-2-hydroxyacid dehydrogenase family protein [Vibrio mimicus]EEW11653.1 D-3-phosphoglycerate dehydrogenase [Vibrio mimicus VM573]EGU19213.1 D-isomerspecific 2-hydroxyacid dehydrogenase family protein [Vibrio mimicus SX-4]KFE32762.1 putative d-3-phosphoglycerate dehydrogenase oxidoreductase protein [Vibrio mimicus]PNM64126.1 3-phosphoglycerate dehydrogenase [Vibrio mimicus]